MKALLSAGVVVCAPVISAARADIIVARANAPVATGDGYYAYTYNVQLTAGQLDPVSGGTPVQFGTVYDFGPLVTTAGVINNPSSASSVFISRTGLLADSNGQFQFSFPGSSMPASTGTTSTVVADNPNLTNVRLTYVGTTGVYVTGSATTLGGGAMGVGAGAANLGTFTIYSPIGTTNPALTYDGQTYRGTNNTVQANQGVLSGPLNSVVPTSVPEPVSLALLGIGVAGIAAVRRRAG